ncbi:MAG: hypothetical protein IT282_07890 [Bacteroidetes bacterium]|nr:hypothetical protein [Bacteroidota bacterium]
MRVDRITPAWILLALLAIFPGIAMSQPGAELQHTRGRLWENLVNDGMIGSLAAWDFEVYAPLGFFPGFAGWTHPIGNENKAVNTFSNANFHNFRSGCWIVAKDVITVGQPPTYLQAPHAFESSTTGLQDGSYGLENALQPLVRVENFSDRPGFDPLLPEELITAQWNTNLGITVTRRSYTWSFPGYRDFIIYDYVFRNTGLIVCTYTSALPPDSLLPRFRQTIKDAYFVFHSGISVSTKSQINFYDDVYAIMAGGFGWDQKAYHDYYHIHDDGELVFSTNFDGGKYPPHFNTYAEKTPSEWQTRFGSELMSPSAFGWVALYASPRTGGGPRLTPKPDVLRVDSHKGGKLNNQSLDLEKFVHLMRGHRDFYTFATTADTQAALGNSGNRENFYTFSYGPYTIAPGDSVRVIVGEIAGVMDMHEAINGDPQGHFPDSSIAAIRRNAAFARQAVAWGVGGTAGGMPIAADVPEPPPPPTCDAVNASFGTDVPIISVVWEKQAETAQILDASGQTFYSGATDLAGYRIYRSTDFQYSSESELPAFRGEAWELVGDIPIGTAPQYFDTQEGRYRYNDSTVTFGFRYGYYVSAYRSANPAKTWTSANGTVITGIPELESGSVNKTLPTSAAPGPVPTMDIFVAPNPYVYGDPERSFGRANPFGLEFRNLPEACTIKIYTLVGDLVRTLEHKPDARGGVYGSEGWDKKSDSGLLVAPGLYVYHVISTTPGLDRTLTGKLVIIR